MKPRLSHWGGMQQHLARNLARRGNLMLIDGKTFWLCSRSQAGVILLMNMGEETQPSFLGFGKQVQLKVMKNLAIRRGRTSVCVLTPTLARNRSNKGRHDVGNAEIPSRTGVVAGTAEVPINGIAVSWTDLVISFDSASSSFSPVRQ
jgi:hypothetical protein